MSIFGKILGGAAGFAMGGPIGVLLGLAAGHAYDRMRQERGGTDPLQSLASPFMRRPPPPPDPPKSAAEERQIAFTAAIVALAAKLAKADGAVSRDEIEAFKTAFKIPHSELPHVGRLFDAAKVSPDGFETYARQIGELFSDSQVIREEILDSLFLVAIADRDLTASELGMLRRIAELMNLPAATFDQVSARHKAPRDRDPYAVLGVKSSAPDAEIRRVWKTLVRENHPDLLIAKGLPPDFVEIANTKLAAINAAYDRIAKQRGFK